jgi:K+-sensing histidine kinase KdpD/DNA-binding winged helix-turn-helix (wHTH) protein
VELKWRDAEALDEAVATAHFPPMSTDLFALHDRRPSAGLRFAGFAGALLMVAGATLAGLLIGPKWGNAPVVLLYLPPVLLAAIYAGFWPSLVAASAATLTYNYYFTAPYRTLRIHSPADVVTVVILFLVAVVTSQLAASLRGQAQLAASHAARNATIAGFARKLLSCADEADIAALTVRELSRLFRCHVTLVVDQEAPRSVASVPSGVVLGPSDLTAAVMTLQSGQPAGRGIRGDNLADWQFHPIAPGETVLAAIGLALDNGTRPVGDEQLPLLGNLLDQVALALERSRLEGEARETATLRERDALRSALLASIGEDVKPRLNAIAAATRTLRREGAADKAVVASVTSEITKLDRYIDNLVELSPGKHPEPIHVGPLTIDLHRRRVSRDGAEVHLTPKEYAVLAELAKQPGRVLTHTQLLRTVWGPAQQTQLDYLRVAVRSLRQKLESSPAAPELIINEPAVGYRLTAPDIA